MCLLYGTQVRANGDFYHVFKAAFFHSGADFTRRGVLAELSHKRRGDNGDHLFAALHGADRLVNLALVGNRAKGTVDQTHTAVDAFVVIDLCPPVLVGADRVHPARGGAGALNLGDRPIGTLIEAFAAFDALALIDMTVLALVQIDRVLRADVLAGVGQTALTTVRNADLLGRTGVTGKGDDVDQRFFKVLFGLGVSHFFHLVDGGADRQLLFRRLDVHAQRQTQTLFDNGPFQKYVLTVLGDFALDHFVGNQVDPVQVSALIGQKCDFLEDAPPDVVYRAVYASHISVISLCFRRRHVAYRPRRECATVIPLNGIRIISEK